MTPAQVEEPRAVAVVVSDHEPVTRGRGDGAQVARAVQRGVEVLPFPSVRRQRREEIRDARGPVREVRHLARERRIHHPFPLSVRHRFRQRDEVIAGLPRQVDGLVAEQVALGEQRQSRSRAAGNDVGDIVPRHAAVACGVRRCREYLRSAFRGRQQLLAPRRPMHRLEHEQLPRESCVQPGLQRSARADQNRRGDRGRAPHGFVEEARFARERMQLEIEQHDARRAAVQLLLRRVPLNVTRNGGPSAATCRVNRHRAEPVLRPQRGIEIRTVRRAAFDRAAPPGEQRTRQRGRHDAGTQRRVQETAAARHFSLRASCR